MTWLWYLLIVIGVAMIVMAFWPGRRSKNETPPEENEEGLG
jgi:cbb3-type cytochrome oxidase subunit 3